MRKEMSEMEMKDVRRKYRILNFTLIAVVFSMAMGMFVFAINHTMEKNVEQTKDLLMATKEQHLKDHVNNTIFRIEGKRNQYINLHEEILEMLEDQIMQVQAQGIKGIADLWKSKNGHLVYDGVNLVVYDEKSKKKYLETYRGDITQQPVEDLRKHISSTMMVSREKVIGEYGFLMWVDDEYVNQLVKQEIREDIYALQFSDHQYVWINEVIDYDGGENYAIRFAHPNLRETEGISLSTEMEDIKGNKPYLEELEGIKANGEVTFQYYFKKIDSEEMTEKLTYAKLYKPYNWIIASGVHLDDVEEYLQLTHQYGNEIGQEALIWTSIAISVSFFLVFIISFRLERAYYGKMEKKIEQEIEFDGLTQAYQRKTGERRLELIWESFKRDGMNNHIVMIDIDNFKKINDCYGHDVGDSVLKRVVELVQNNILDDDMLCRWGGEEFLLLLPNRSDEVCEELGNRLVHIIGSEVFMLNDEEIVVTVSIGGARFEIHDESYHQGIKRADLALYQAKQTGKNRYCS